MRRLVIVGDDPRDDYVAELAASTGWTVDLWTDATASSFPDGASLLGPLSGIDALGQMITRRGVIRLDPAILTKMAGGVCAAGLVAPSVRRLAESLGIHVVSYRDSEAFAWKNAVLTADGAIQVAIGASGYGIFQRPVGILGYGRVGRTLARRLALLGAQVSVWDREPMHRAEAESQGLPAYPLSPDRSVTIDMLFNTIPHPVITREWERQLMDVLIFDLASAPGGVAPEVDRAKLSLTVLAGIPGQVAPKRAAEIVWETVMAIDSRSSPREEREPWEH